MSRKSGPPHSRITSGLLVPALPLVAYDWSGSKLDYTFTGRKVMQTTETLIEWMRGLSKPYRVVGEQSFESYHGEDVRSEVVQVAKQLGHELMAVASRTTEKERRGKEEKSDIVDCRTIYRIAKEGKHHLKHVVIASDVPDREAAKQQVIKLRRRGWPNVPAIVKTLPDIKAQPAFIREALGDGKKYSHAFVGTMFIAATDPYSTTRDRFEKFIGAYEHGYPSVFRATYERRNWLSRARKRRMPADDFRRAVRWLYRQFKGGPVDSL